MAVLSPHAHDAHRHDDGHDNTVTAARQRHVTAPSRLTLPHACTRTVISYVLILLLFLLLLLDLDAGHAHCNTCCFHFCVCFDCNSAITAWLTADPLPPPTLVSSFKHQLRTQNHLFSRERSVGKHGFFNHAFLARIRVGIGTLVWRLCPGQVRVAFKS